MAGPSVSDHAMLRWLERVGGLDVEGLRAGLSGSLARAEDTARSMGGGDYTVRFGAAVCVVRAGVLVTVLTGRTPRERAAMLCRPLDPAASGGD